MMKIIIFAMFLCCLAPADALNKCTAPDGKVTYTDASCGDAARTTEIKDPQPSAATASEAGLPAPLPESYEQKLKTVQSDRRKYEIKRQLDTLDIEIRGYRSDMDRELEALQNSKAYSRNNLAGATRDQSISAEMQAVAKGYETKIKIAQEREAALRSELAAMENRK